MDHLVEMADSSLLEGLGVSCLRCSRGGRSVEANGH